MWMYALSLILSLVLSLGLFYFFLIKAQRRRWRKEAAPLAYLTPTLLALLLLWIGGGLLFPRLLDLHSLYYGIYQNESVQVTATWALTGRIKTDQGVFYVDLFGPSRPQVGERGKIRYLPWSRYGEWQKEK